MTTENKTCTDLLSRLQELERRDHDRVIFGSGEHGYRVKPASEAAIARFEARYGARLPAGFRRLLLEVTDGGAGPGYGLFPLRRRPDDDVAEDLSLLGQPFDGGEFLSLASPETNPDDDPEAYEEARSHYWREMPGTMTLCHYGCAIRASLVVTGPLAGQVLLDHRCDYEGVRPFTPALSAAWHGRPTPLVEQKPLAVLAWYSDWIDASLAALANLCPRRHRRASAP